MAVTIIASELATTLNIVNDDERVARLLEYASAIVQEYTRESIYPGGVENVAVERVAGWLHQRSATGNLEQQVGDLHVKFPVGMSPLRNSGAMSILSPFKQRRAI